MRPTDLLQGTETQDTKGRPAALVMLLLASTLGVMAGAIVMPVLEVIRNDLGVTGTAAGLIITTHGLTIALVSPVIGRLLDRWGARLPLAIGLVVYGVGGGLGVVAPNYPALIASRMVLGLGAAAVFGGTTVALLTFYKGAMRDKVMGWRTTATTMGGMVWPLLAGVLGGFTWHATFAIYLVGIPLGVAVLLSIPADAGSAESDEDQAQGKAQGKNAAAAGGGALRLVREYPTLLAWYGLTATLGIMLYTLAVFLPQRLAEIGVTHPLFVSLFLVVSSVVASVIGLFYARVRARLGYGALLRIFAGSWTVAFLILGTAPEPAPLFIASALFGVGNGLAMPAVTVLIGDTPPPERRGQATALSGTAMFAGQFVSPLIFGPLMAATSITTGYLVAAGISLVILAILLRSRVTAPGNESEAAPVDPARRDRMAA